MSASLNDRLEQFFRQHSGAWLNGMDIARYGGCYGWRTRVSELRTLRGMTIENRQRRLTNQDGKKYTVSEYRYVPVSLLDLVEQPIG